MNIKNICNIVVNITSEAKQNQYLYFHMKDQMDLGSYDFMDCINWNPDSLADFPILQDLAPNQELDNISQKKAEETSLKNKNIKKNKKNSGEISTKGKAAPRASNSQYSQPYGDKKNKNRIAAKQSRDRKKIYIDILQQQTKQMEQQLSKTNKEIQQCKIDIQKSVFANNQYTGTFTPKLGHVHKKLEKLISEEEDDDIDNEINLAIDSSCYRFGAAGKERQFKINQCYKQIFNLANPSIHRYLLWAAESSVHLFSKCEGFMDDQNQKWFKQMKEYIGDLSHKSQIIQQHQSQLKERRLGLFKLINRLSQTKKQMQKQSNELQNLFLDVREILTPVQCAKFILFIEKYSYRNQIRFHEADIQEESVKQDATIIEPQ